MISTGERTESLSGAARKVRKVIVLLRALFHILMSN